MQLGSMAIIAAFLVIASGECQAAGSASELERRIGLSMNNRRAWHHRRHRRRDRVKQLRLSGGRRWRRDEAAVEESAPAPPPLALPAGVHQLSLDQLEREEEARQETLHRYSRQPAGFSVCCPASEERTSPRAGRRADGSLALLHADHDFRQIFFERSCLNQTDAQVAQVRRLTRRPYRCVQEYSYSYAVYNINGDIVLDYIRIRSGCKCEIKHRSKRKKKRRRNRRKEAQRREREARRERRARRREARKRRKGISNAP